MIQNVKKAGSTLALVAMMVLLAAASAMAQTPADGDYSAVLATVKTTVVAAMNANAPLLIAIMVVFVIFGFVWRKIKAAAKGG